MQAGAFDLDGASKSIAPAAGPEIAQPELEFTASMMRDIERGNRIEADHAVGGLVARGTPDGTRLLRISLAHLKSYVARRAREAAR